eukprot:gnl/Spiro4/5006_TR2503_c1_g1_i1.p1 gnl/Spiro4/5006_TR2503_c1_g1~~gnl/Spiro4/5006_TR2503_c1_g1_i1.p1  ORF type:complete len:222 (+),score=43.63 gnl/Spiro4/5006_TR2503_c1_g1_i1:75-740(+)
MDYPDPESITLVLRQLHPFLKMHASSILLLQEIFGTFIRRLVTALVDAVGHDAARTTGISADQFKSTVSTFLTPELAKHALSEMVKAGAAASAATTTTTTTTTITTASATGSTATRLFTVPPHIPYHATLVPLPGMLLHFAACMEYLTAEILELAGNAAKDNKDSRIRPSHISMAIRFDAELIQVFYDVDGADSVWAMKMTGQDCSPSGDWWSLGFDGDDE